METILKPADKEDIIKSFEEFTNQPDYWKGLDEIAVSTGSTATEIHNVIVSLDEFVENKEGKYTTRDLYEKRTPFLVKMFNAWKGEIA